MRRIAFLCSNMFISDRVCVLCYFVWCLFLLFLTKDIAAQHSGSPSKDFSRHALVRPTVYHEREKRHVSSTRNENGVHHPELTITVNLDGQDYILDLRLNKDLISANHVVRYQKNGDSVLHKPGKEDLDLCQYSGHIKGLKYSWVAVSTCHGLRGVLYDGKTMKYIEPIHGDLNSDHYVYSHDDHTAKHRCGYSGGITKNTNFDKHLHEHFNATRMQKLSRISRYKRETMEDTQVRGPYNSNKLSRYVELVLVADNREFKANGENLNTVHHQMKDVANVINSLYAPLNIFITLVGVVVWSERDEISLEENGDTTLTNFLHYRKMRLLQDIPNDNAQLLTRQAFKDGVVGKALKGPICTFEFSGGVSTNHTEVLGLVATTIAHEMGHNFGMEHDTEEDCQCPDDKCIMSPSSTSTTPTHWSSCSLKSLALAFERGMDYCLRNKPTRLFESPTCGNGFVEPGEQCDCGLQAGRAPLTACHACCHPDTCMLRLNATCATGQCCDLQTCKPKSAGTVCRSADQECDLPEYCTGYSEFCPKDVHKMDTTPCDNKKAYCVAGSCRSHRDQCRLLWGTTGERSHDNCYTSMNTKGTKHGNCGYDRVQQKYLACAGEHALCGLLHCRHLNEQLEFGMESVSTLSHTFINNNGTIIPCRTAIIDLGLGQVDPGLVPDGALCGDQKVYCDSLNTETNIRQLALQQRGGMCLNQRCVAVAEIREAIAKKDSSVCPSNCSDHGICNSEGQCHCERGFAPPLCALPGPGGSVNSGPATDPSVQKNFMVAMYVIFLGILPAILLTLLLMYYTRHNMPFWWNKPRKSLQSPKKNSLQRRLSRGASKFAANFQNNSNPPGAPGIVAPASPDDMSSSLLRSDSENGSGNVNPTVNFFGNFKGFSLTPMEKNAAEQVATISASEQKSAKITPVHRSNSNAQNILKQTVLKPVLRTAPPLPVVPASKGSPTIKRTNSSVQDRIKAFMGTERPDVPSIVNPPLRPVISSPILEASTCTAKELMSPLQGSKTLGPVRPAPNAPNDPALPKRPLSMHGNVLQKPLPDEPKKVREGISLNRIASFLKQDKPKERNLVERSNSLPKNSSHQVKVPKSTMDKTALRNLQISNPILQKQIELPVNTVSVVSDSEDCDDPRFISRTQSMRGPSVMQKPAIQSFGSMRQAPGAPRPVSVVGRPTAPPPPRPTVDTTSAYQSPKSVELKPEDYVDCIEEKAAQLSHIDEESGDNIYAIIEESPQKAASPLPEGYQAPRPIISNTGSTESIGLLEEIVTEIQNRNPESIYSAATLARRKKERERQPNADSDRDSTYMNSEYKTPESVYSNSGAKSTVSTTSSGYLHPSAVNVPTFAPQEPTASNDKAPPSPTLKVNSKIPTFTRQVTPPGLRNTTTFRNVPPSPKSPKQPTNSPDVVSSCAIDAKNPKPPDVINNNKMPNEIKPKPVITAKPVDNRPPLRPAPTVDKKIKTTQVITPKPQDKITSKTNTKSDSVKAIADNLNKNKPKTVPKPTNISVARTDSKPGAKLASRPSNVASLQQKFENRKSFGRETSVKK